MVRRQVRRVVIVVSSRYWRLRVRRRAERDRPARAAAQPAAADPAQPATGRDFIFDLGEIVVVGTPDGEPGVGGVGADPRADVDLRSQVARPGRQHGARRGQHVRRQRPPQRERHLRARLRPLAGAADGGRRAHLPAGRQPARLQPLPDRRHRRGADPEGLRVGARRPRRDGRRDQSRDAQAGQAVRGRGQRLDSAAAATPRAGTRYAMARHAAAEVLRCRAASTTPIATSGRCRATTRRRRIRCSRAGSA